MLRPLPGFQALETLHCVSGSLRNVYEYHGYHISEEMLLGLGSAVGFVYLHTKGTVPILSGRVNQGLRDEGFYNTIGRRTGVRIDTFTTTNAAKAERVMLDSLAAGEPVMLHVDMAYLPYFRLPQGQHFGGHVVVAAGHDSEAGEVTVADRDGMRAISSEQLGQARASKWHIMPARNRWYSTDFSSTRPLEPQEIVQAMREVAEGMLRPRFASCGLLGMRRAAAAALRWPRLMDEAQLRRSCFNAYAFIDTVGGTGGGAFRYIYPRFLVEASEIVGDRRLVEVAEHLRVAGDEWQRLAEMLKAAAAAPDPIQPLSDISAQIRNIAEHEQASWTWLARIVGEAHA